MIQHIIYLLAIVYLVGMAPKVLNVELDPLKGSYDVAEAIVSAIIWVGPERQGLQGQESQRAEAIADVHEHHFVLLGCRRGRPHFIVLLQV